MNNRKRLLAICCSLVLSLSICQPAFTNAESNSQDDPWVVQEEAVKNIINDTQECTLNKHFNVKYNDFMSQTKRELKQEGIHLNDYSAEYYEKIYLDKIGESTRYEIEHKYSADPINKSVEINFDPKSCRIHSVCVHASSADECKTLFTIVMGGLGIDEQTIKNNWQDLMRSGSEQLRLDDYRIYLYEGNSSSYVEISAVKNHGSYTFVDTEKNWKLLPLLRGVKSNEYDNVFNEKYTDFISAEGDKLNKLNIDFSDPDVFLHVSESRTSDVIYSVDNLGSSSEPGCSIRIDSATGFIKRFKLSGKNLDREMEALSYIFEGIGMTDFDIKKDLDKIRTAAKKLGDNPDTELKLKKCDVRISKISGYDAPSYYIYIDPKD